MLTRLTRTHFAHFLKCVLFMFASMLVFALIAPYLPGWLFKAMFLSWGIFVFFPVVFAAGPIGRRIGRQLNEAAIQKANAERAALGPRQPLDGG